MNKCRIVLCFLCVVICTLAGCSSDENEEMNAESMFMEYSDIEYTAYYLNNQETGLIEADVDIDNSLDAELIAEELFDIMKYPEDSDYISVVSSGLSINSVELTDQVMYIDFNAEYLNMNDSREVLFKAAVVKAMSQIDGVSYVAFNIDGIPLTYNNGTNVGIMEASNFIDESENMDLSAVTLFSTIVYFSNTAGTALVGENVDISYGPGLSLEAAVIKKIIEGSDISEAKRTVNPSLKLLSTSTKEGICYVNFDTSFLESLSDVSADVVVYAIVNSLCELPNITRVQLMIKGSTDYTFRDTYALNTFFERNLNLIEATY